MEWALINKHLEICVARVIWQRVFKIENPVKAEVPKCYQALTFMINVVAHWLLGAVKTITAVLSTVEI